MKTTLIIVLSLFIFASCYTKGKTSRVGVENLKGTSEKIGDELISFNILSEPSHNSPNAVLQFSYKQKYKVGQRTKYAKFQKKRNLARFWSYVGIPVSLAAIYINTNKDDPSPTGIFYSYAGFGLAIASIFTKSQRTKYFYKPSEPKIYYQNPQILKRATVNVVHNNKTKSFKTNKVGRLNFSPLNDFQVSNSNLSNYTKFSLYHNNSFLGDLSLRNSLWLTEYAKIIKNQSHIYSMNNENSELIGLALNSKKYRIKKKLDNFINIDLSSNNNGWINSSDCELINLNPSNTEEDVSLPQISVIKPNLNRGFTVVNSKNSYEIQGQVFDNLRIKSISINNNNIDYQANGYFKTKVELYGGKNKFEIKATDAADNIAIKQFYIENNIRSQNVSAADLDVNFKAAKYHALIIGVEDYTDNSIVDLVKPVSDAQKLYNILLSDYSFMPENVKFLKNPTRNEITKSLEYYFENINKDDNLLIFYAGHGYWDERFKQGYWLASDAERSNRGTWLSNSTIRDYMRAIPTQHSLLITDACFGGGIFKSRNAFANATIAINKLYALPSRKAITSGALSEVPDNSVFIEYLVKRLAQNKEKYLSSEQLFASFKIAVINNSSNSQVPQFGEVKETGDEGGDFIFIHK